MTRLSDSIVRMLAAAETARSALPSAYQGDDRPYASADVMSVFAELRKHAGRGLSFLEWGSGLGTITIIANQLGYQAFGIEIDALLVETARQLAASIDSGATFAVGNYLPTAARQSNTLLARLNSLGPLVLDGPDGYAALGRRVEEFDLIYVFPWPDQIDLCHDLFARYARVGARLLVYSQTMDMLEAVKGPRGCSTLRPA